MKSNIESKHRRKFIENFVLKIETISQQLSNLQAEQPSRYLDMRLNWMSLIRTYIDHFDYMHIPREDVSQYDDK